MRRTEILASLGSVRELREALTAMIKAGINAVKYNFYHGTNKDHYKKVDLKRQITRRQDIYVSILSDLQGLRIGLKKFRNDSEIIKNGQKLTLDTNSGVKDNDENVKVVQKLIITTASQNKKCSITATKMIKLMIESSSLTRAKASDGTNAIFDGTNAIMLSDEIAVGQYPVEIITAMSRICESAENSKYTHISKKYKIHDCDRVDYVVSIATVKIVNNIKVKELIVQTKEENTFRCMSRINTALTTYTLSRNARRTLGAMIIFRGIVSIYFKLTRMLKLFVNRSVSTKLEDSKLAKACYIFVLTSGDSIGIYGSTNKIKVIIAGQVR